MLTVLQAAELVRGLSSCCSSCTGAGGGNPSGCSARALPILLVGMQAHQAKGRVEVEALGEALVGLQQQHVPGTHLHIRHILEGYVARLHGMAMVVLVRSRNNSAVHADPI